MTERPRDNKCPACEGEFNSDMRYGCPFCGLQRGMFVTRFNHAKIEKRQKAMEEHRVNMERNPGWEMERGVQGFRFSDEHDERLEFFTIGKGGRQDYMITMNHGKGITECEPVEFFKLKKRSDPDILSEQIDKIRDEPEE